MTSRINSLRPALLAGKPLIGLFARFSEPEVAETLAQSRLDFLILDVEHGSFSRSNISRFVFAAQAQGMPVIVRLPDGSPSGIQHAVAIGSSGIIVPHLASRDEAAKAVQFARGLAIERAYAGMGRIAELRTIPWTEFKSFATDRLTFIAQIDEPPGIEASAEIAAVEGIDCVFLGRLGLSLALGAPTPNDPRVDEALNRVCEACQSRQRRVGMHLLDPKQVPAWAPKGVNLFAVGSDYSLLFDAANLVFDKFSN